MQPWRQSLSLFVKPNVLPCLHFTQIKGLVPLQLSSSHLSHTHPHTTKQVSGLVLSDCPRSVWSFLQREFLAIVINLTRLIKLTWSDFRSSSPVCWACNCQPSFIGPELLCHWSGSSTALASCRYLLPLFLCWKLWGGRKHEKTKQGFTSCGHSGQAVCREQSLSQNTGPWAKLSGSFLSVLLHNFWRILKE